MNPPVSAKGLTAPALARLRYVRGRMPVCDGIRGIAVLLVVILHSAAFRIPVPPILAHAYSVGWIGVDIFFVLSGFLITGILLDTKNDPGYFKKFYARRALRIFPLYYALVAFSFVILPFISTYLPLRFAEGIAHAPASSAFWYLTFTSNIGGALFGMKEVATLGVVWSLAIEEQFYLIWPLIVRTCSTRAFTRICVAVIISGCLLRIALVFTQIERYSIYELTFTRCDGLALGALIALAYRNDFLSVRCLSYAKIVLPIGLAGFLGAAAYQGSFVYSGPSMQIFGYPGLALFAAALLVLAVESDLQNGMLAHVLRLRALTWPGGLCYGLYLTHALLILPLRPIYLDYLGLDWRSYPALHQLIFTALVLTLSLGLAWSIWTLLESPILQLKRKFEYVRE
jgi:peptidoglycan/LPS O-acetylase OafA/YrhL